MAATARSGQVLVTPLSEVYWSSVEHTAGSFPPGQVRVLTLSNEKHSSLTERDYLATPQSALHPAVSRQAPGATPISRVNAREKVDSDS